MRIGTKWYQEYLGKRYEVDATSIIIKLRVGIPDSALRQFHRENNTVEARSNGYGFAYLTLPNSADPLDVLVRYSNSGMVEFAEPSTFGKYLGVPNDPLFSSQWHLTKIKMPQAWDIQEANPSVIVGILDSGTDWLHPDIGPGTDGFENIWTNETVGPYGTTENDWSDPTSPGSGQGDDDDANGNAFHLYIDDWKGWDYNGGYYQESNDSRGLGKGHGTLVAGIVGAKTNNGTGVAGVAGGFYGAGIRMLILSIGEFGPTPGDLADAIYYAAQKGARVIQLSLEIASSGVINNALTIAHDTYGCLIVCASGNDNMAFVSYPARHPKVVAVGATNQNDFRCAPPDWDPPCPSCGSNYGTTLDLAAPGRHIFTTVVSNGYGWQTDDNGNGTSYSAPQVSGLAALLFCYNPNNTHDQVENIMKQTADKTGGYDYNWDPSRPGHSRELGYGRINAYKALSMANGPPAAPQNVQVIATPPDQYGYRHPYLTWNVVSPDVESIHIERRKSTFGEWSGWSQISQQPGSATSFTDFSIGTAGYGSDFAEYRIRAKDAADQISPYSLVVSIAISSDMFKGSGQENVEQPITFSLSQNYPNPFNPSTTIRYSLPSDAFVSLRLFNSLGEEVASIVNGQKNSGRYEILFDASSLPSGVYYYRLIAGVHTVAKKMIIAK